MKHLRVYESVSGIFDKAVKVGDMLTEYIGAHERNNRVDDISVLKVSSLDTRGDLMIEFAGDIYSAGWSKFSKFIDILVSLDIKWRFSLGGGYIDISFLEEEKIDSLIEELEVLLQTKKFNL